MRRGNHSTQPYTILYHSIPPYTTLYLICVVDIQLAEWRELAKSAIWIEQKRRKNIHFANTLGIFASQSCFIQKIIVTLCALCAKSKIVMFNCTIKDTFFVIKS